MNRITSPVLGSVSPTPYSSPVQPADDGESFLSGLHIAGIDEARGVRGRRLLRVGQPVCRKGERIARGRAQRGGEDVALAVRQREGLQARRDLSGDGPGLLQGAVRAGRRRGRQQRRKAELDASPHDGGAHGRQKYLFVASSYQPFISAAACWPVA